MHYVYETYGKQVYISLMSQYTPFDRLKSKPEYKELCRKVTKREYQAVVNYIIELGVENAFIQEGDVAKKALSRSLTERELIRFSNLWKGSCIIRSRLI